MAKNSPAQTPARLLFSRRQTADILGGISTVTCIRLERDGLLTPVKLKRSPNAQTFYRASEVHALAEGNVKIKGRKTA